jgi:hypoxanthine phosphoribosyltransferase
MKVINYTEKLELDFCVKVLNFLKEKKTKNILVIGIESGGIPIAKSVSKYLISKNMNVKYGSLKCCRPSSKKKKKFNYLANLVRFLPRRFTDYLRILEHRFLSTKKPKVREISNIVMPTIEEVDSIVLIDDAVDSGYSLEYVIDYLLKTFNVNVYSGVVVVTQESPVIEPDIYCYRNVLIRFPWSLDAKK